MAPFIGVVADVLGRRRIIAISIFLLMVPTALIAAARTVDQIVVLRFVQGLLLPPVFAVAVAYIGDEFPRDRIAGVTATYTTGSILGGFLGRFLSGWIGEYGGWRLAFLVLAALNLACAIIVVAMLPRERNFVRAEGLIHSVTMMARHFRDARLVATFAVGFGVLFCFVTLFTFMNFYLAAPPFNLSAAEFGWLFVVYIVRAFQHALDRKAGRAARPARARARRVRELGGGSVAHADTASRADFVRADDRRLFRLHLSGGFHGLRRCTATRARCRPSVSMSRPIT